MAKFHQRKQLIKKYLAGKTKYFKNLSKKQAASPTQTANKQPASPTQEDSRYMSPIQSKPVLHVLLSPRTITKIAINKAAALERRFVNEANAAPLPKFVISISDDAEPEPKSTCVLCNQPCSDIMESMSMCNQCQELSIIGDTAAVSPKHADAPASTKRTNAPKEMAFNKNPDAPKSSVPPEHARIDKMRTKKQERGDVQVIKRLKKTTKVWDV